MQRMKLFHGNANPDLAASVAAYLGVPTGRARVTTFSDGEIQCEIEENVRGLDCFVVQSTSNPANRHLMELLIMVDALRRSSARSSRSACASGASTPSSSSRRTGRATTACA